MSMKTTLTILMTGAVLLAVAAAGVAAPLAGSPANLERAGWLLQRTAVADRALLGFASDQVEIGGSAPEMPSYQESISGKKAGLHILSSLILPGSGEAMLGYKRGYVMMAADIFAWTRVIKYDNDGDDIQQEFFDYADDHWSVDRLVAAYDPSSEDEVRGGLGLNYFDDVTPVSSVDDFQGNLPLWISVEDDHWEYYENLGKWDQFVFGWDDFVNPNDTVLTGGYVPTGTLADLRQPFTSHHRDIYREMRGRSDDAYSKRDNWLYMNIGLRVFSVIQTAYLEGILGGGPSRELDVSGHRISLLAQPVGLKGGTMAAVVSF